jgi:hypothetical protein
VPGPSACVAAKGGAGTPPVAANVKCGDWGCGVNGATMGNLLPFHEIDASGEFPNSAGLCFKGMLGPDGKERWRLLVSGDRLFGIDPKNGVHEGGGLVNATLLFDQAPWQAGQRCSDPPARPSEEYPVVITDAQPMSFWVNPECSPCFWAYEFKYAPPRKNERETLCKGQNLSEWNGAASQIALVFAGDRYNGRDKTVTATGSGVGGWFNIACAGTVVAKMHLLRHTEAGLLAASGSCPARVTTQDDRQAMLKMITDDLCGTGRSFTHDGKDVFYMDRQGFYPFDLKDATRMEAIWTSTGPVCLSEPRLQSEDPCTWTEIKNECGAKLVPCETLAPPWSDHGYGISAINGNMLPHNNHPNWPQCPLPPPPPPDGLPIRGALEIRDLGGAAAL